MIRAIVVDDELAAVGKLSDLLEGSGFVRSVEGFTNPMEALKRVEESPFDIAFLDIEMPGINGLTLANHILGLTGQTKVVFVTAYNEYAVEAFELYALDYLIKPVTKERLTKTLDRAADFQTGAIMQKDKLNVDCFGKFRVAHKDNTPVKWRTSKTEELFAYLVHQNGRWVGRDKIMDALWSEFDRQRALTNFSTCLYNMRKTLKDLGWPELLLIENNMFKLDMEQISSDIQQFEAYDSRMEPVRSDNLSGLEHILERASSGYLEMNYFDWTEPTKGRLEEAWFRQTGRLASYYEEIGQIQKAVELLKKSLSRDFFRPGLNEALIRLYVKSNERVYALKQYKEYKRRLDQEYGMKPDEGLERWIQQMK